MNPESDQGAPVVGGIFGASFDMVPNPITGKGVWPRIQFVYGITAYTIALPPESFRALMLEFNLKAPDLLKEVEKQNGAKTDIVVPKLIQVNPNRHARRSR